MSPNECELEISSRRYSFSNSSLFFNFSISSKARIDESNGSLIGKQPQPTKVGIAHLDTAENGQDTQRLGTKNERLTGETADVLAGGPLRAGDPLKSFGSIVDQEWSRGGADLSDFANAEGETPEVSSGSGPVRIRLGQRAAIAGGQV